MYAVSVSGDFVAQHVLTVPEAGPEGEWHSHRYGVRLEVRGELLDEHGYLVDVDDLTAALDSVVDRYRDETLNDFPEFEGNNPSLERFARIICDRALAELDDPIVDAAAVELREDDVARATYEREI
ncbi:6-pyruvoyl tetrahydropterin synthase [Halobacteriales archaeon QS_1_68_20]|nr:MAG: 6-pyruvoyl tetrahydropterin synthase [Halobacteriales archaeon QS_1_68_20]